MRSALTGKPRDRRNTSKNVDFPAPLGPASTISQGPSGRSAIRCDEPAPDEAPTGARSVGIDADDATGSLRIDAVARPSQLPEVCERAGLSGFARRLSHRVCEFGHTRLPLECRDLIVTQHLLATADRAVLSWEATTGRTPGSVRAASARAC
jgi:hypothetical protein